MTKKISLFSFQRKKRHENMTKWQTRQALYLLGLTGILYLFSCKSQVSVNHFFPIFPSFFQKVFHILPGLLISFSTKPACCLHLIHAHPQQVSFGTTIYTHFNQAFYKFSLSSVFYKFSLVFFSAMCYIKKNVFTGYTVTILFFQITIQQILFREAFSL